MAFKRKSKFSEEELEVARFKREQLIRDGESMKRLMLNPDYQRLVEILKEEGEGINKTLLNENIFMGDRMLTDLARVRLIARINQIDRCISKPRSICWGVKNLTEVRLTTKEQTRERQALGNKTGG